MIVLISGTDKQLSILKSLMREKVSFIWYTYDFIPRQIAEFVNVDLVKIDSPERKFLNNLTNSLDDYNDICHKDCMTVIDDYLNKPTAKHLFVAVPNNKLNKFKEFKDCFRVNVITDPNLVSGSLKFEKYSLYDYALYNAHDKKTMDRKVSEFLKWLEIQENRND